MNQEDTLPPQDILVLILGESKYVDSCSFEVAFASRCFPPFGFAIKLHEGEKIRSQIIHS